MKKLIRLLIIVALIAVILKVLAPKAANMKEEWQGLTEAEVRDKLDSKLSRARVPQDKLAVIQDKVVDKMRSTGALKEDAVVSAAAPDNGQAD